ncbi:hypothetical protein LTR62_002029 [Meristemomyces frigidus]|uniref:TATA element modulatory factor 1 TATA binding domain-containing protein n=1 Tax=Meristemomyces frigidus TaxID=1508187 RepID=A0AAN7YSC4_9PEZI|nr:hypothetical protein LTR62_002029 [Meristemomyces frigidus]
MASKQPPAAKKGGWGSLLSGAVANLESRLDTILAEDSEASARQRANEAALKEAKAAPTTQARTNSGSLAALPARSAAGSRDASRTRVNDRLAERLAKATATKKLAGDGAGDVDGPSRVASPVNGGESARTSADSTRPAIAMKSVPEVLEKAVAADGTGQDTEYIPNGDVEPVAAEDTLLTSRLPLNPSKVSMDSSRPSIEISQNATSARPSIELLDNYSPPEKDATELETEIAQMREDHAAAETQRQEEMYAYMEKIDALQAKLQYLAKETVAAAKAANAENVAGSKDALVAEKDERIALLMEEGEKLSKTELRQLQTIKKLRAKASEQDQVSAELRSKIDKHEKTEAELKQKLRRTEVAERQAIEKARQVAVIEKQIDELRVDRENASEAIRSMTIQLKEAKAQAERAEREINSKAAEADRARIAALENDLEDAQIEKNLAEDRAGNELKSVRAELLRQKERFDARDTELRNEVANLESRLEATRAVAEEATSDAGNPESNVKLLRQVETLQSQYSLAKANWETIESTLNARVTGLEKERDEASRRETEIRKKARDAALAKRSVEDQVEKLQEQARDVEQALQGRREEVQRLQKRLEDSDRALTAAKADAERQRKVWDVELSQRLEEEKAKWQRASSIPSTMATSNRKASATELSSLHSTTSLKRQINRVTSHNLADLRNLTEVQRPIPLRNTAIPGTPVSPARPELLHRSSNGSPSISRQESTISLDIPSMPPTPSVEVDQDFDTDSQTSGPQRTIQDLVSTSTAAGPSVQVVERMSALVRRLETEKATFKDEIARLGRQRDEARDEVVELMREVDGKRKEEGDVVKLGKEMEAVRERYEASLEMLGEREEEVEELRGDLGEMKRMYRELVERKMPVV